MSFIEIGRHFYNTDHIRCVIRPANEGVGERTIIEFVNGDREEAISSFWRRFVDMCDAKIIPALPGFTMLCHWGDDYIEQLPVIAWAIDPFGREFATKPVTVDGIPNDNQEWAVIQPDGKVIKQGDRTYENYEQWLEEKNTAA